jgi:hypothetical protein
MPSAVPSEPTVAQHFELVALLGFAPGHNLYVNADGLWQAPYIPAHYRGFPFGLVPQAGGDHGMLEAPLVLAIRSDSGLFLELLDASAVPLFDDDGAPSATTRHIGQFLHQWLRSQLETQRLLAQLAEHELIQPWPIEWVSDARPSQPGADDTRLRLNGYYGVDEQRLRSLPAAACQALLSSGALQLAYAQLFSRARLPDLQRRLKHAGRRVAAAGGLDLDALFGDNTEELRFDALADPNDKPS